MTSDLEKSLKAKLRSIAQEKKRDPADLWQNLMLERFLVRLSRSSYGSHFILKGGLLLAKYIDIGRETRDLDFLARGISNEIERLRLIFEEIAKIDLNDGFSFTYVTADELIHPHMEYEGAEITMMAYFGRTRFKVAIDVGFGDIVTAVEKTFSLVSYSKGPLFEASAKLACYPAEFIFAEKLETVIHRGAFNSRMKDFHDLHSLITAASALEFQNLKTIIDSVFEHRGTSLSLPIGYNSDKDMDRIQGYWKEYLKSLREEELGKLPLQISELLKFINSWLAENIG